MGRVYRGEQRALGRTVAIKVVHPHLLSDEQSVARFYTEAKAASRLNHPNSVGIIDFGRTDDGILYLVMEFLRGKDLSRLMREDGPLPFGRICGIVCNVLDALGEAHALEVVHRDLKPENVIIERLRSGADLVKVVDFGLAKLMTGGQFATSITMPGLVCGTPDYMSPEQGRGEDVDGRGDIYSVGVMLFELLTETLPFVADTPTNVVLRHIQDPIPDPRDVAPQRAIPAPLAEVTMRALAKKPCDRFQDATEMSTAMQEVMQRLSPRVQEVACPGCGHRSPAQSRFCASCGAPLQVSPVPFASRTGRSAPPRVPRQPTRTRALVGREEELAKLHELRDQAAARFVPVLISGEAGIGKTRLLSEMGERCIAADDLVVTGAPHPAGAPAPYHAIRDLVLGLLGLDWAGLESLVKETPPADAMVAAGLSELVEPVGLRGAIGESRAGAVAVAMRYAAQEALATCKVKRCVLMVDELHRCDGLTLQVLRALPDHSRDLGILLLMAGQATREVPLPRDTEVLELRGLTGAEARAMLSGEPNRSAREPDPDDLLMLPLYVEQLVELGLGVDTSASGLPSRLADAIGQRIQRLPIGARLLLQAVSILGTRTPKTMAQCLFGEDFESNLRLLIGNGLLLDQGPMLQVVHPFVRDLVEASIPAAARKELHERALSIVTEGGAPLEVRGHHAYGSGETLSALVLLERLGDLAFHRGDLGTAVSSYRRALELARRELLQSGDTYLERAIESISRRLGDVLARRGDVAGAEGVLREALEYSAPASVDRAQILVALAGVLEAKQRAREAYRVLGQALEIAVRQDSEETQLEVQNAVARLRRAEGNPKGAIAALSAAWDLLPKADPDRVQRAQLAVELAALHVESQSPEARSALVVAEQASVDAQVPYLVARSKGLWGRLEQARGKTELAQRHFGEAAAQAAIAGDTRLLQRYRSLSGVSRRSAASEEPGSAPTAASKSG